MRYDQSIVCSSFDRVQSYQPEILALIKHGNILLMRCSEVRSLAKSSLRSSLCRHNTIANQKASITVLLISGKLSLNQTYTDAEFM